MYALTFFFFMCKWLLVVRFSLSLHTFLETSVFLLYPRTHMIFLCGVGKLISTLLIFDFAQMFLASNGAILLFHPNDLKVLKEIKFYLKSNGFQRWMKWDVVNSLPFTSSKDSSFKVPSQSTKLSLYFSFYEL